MITFRRSRFDDMLGVENVLYSCFGYREYQWMDNLNGRYLCAINDDEQIVAVGAVNDTRLFASYEVDWVGTLPEYRGQGIMSELLRLELLNYPGIDVYCSCWRIGHNEINLKGPMAKNGFVEIVPCYKKHGPYEILCSQCIYKGCTECVEDLYLRKGKP